MYWECALTILNDKHTNFEYYKIRALSNYLRPKSGSYKREKNVTSLFKNTKIHLFYLSKLRKNRCEQKLAKSYLN